MGSLAHRQSFLTEVHGGHAGRVIIADNGNVAEDAAKIPVVLRAMARAPFDAVNTGALDLRLLDAYAPEAARGKLPLVRALRRGDTLDTLAQDLRLKEIDGHKIGITALPPVPEGEEIDAYLDQAAAALRDLRGRCDVLVLLSQMGLEQDKELAQRSARGGPDLIIGNLDARALAKPLTIGRTTLLPTAGRGAVRAGKADLYIPRRGRLQIEHYEAVAVKGMDPDAPVAEMVKQHYADEQARFIKGVDPKLLVPKITGEGGDVVRCGTCHAREAAEWRRTKHATAMDTLAGRDRLVSECVQCHSTRYRKERVFDHAARTGSVDCTGCHEVSKGQSPCPDGATRTRGQSTCTPCHTPLNSERFNYLNYLPQVDHTKKEDAKQGGQDHDHDH